MWTNSLICYLKFVHALKCLDHIGTITIYINYYIYFCYIQKNKVYDSIWKWWKMLVPYWEWQLRWIKDSCAGQVQKELTWWRAILPQATKCTSSLTASSLELPVFILNYTGGTEVMGGGRGVITFRTPKHINTLSAKLTMFQTCLPQCFLINCLVKKNAWECAKQL